ncbi:MAG: AEC family transporter [Anaerolineae bacterium]|nr:AEC family transporter [Anaerolineae bacterium]
MTLAELSVTQKVIINLLLIAVGYLIKRLGLVAREDGRVLNRMVLYITLPAMNLRVISNTDLSWQLFILPVVFLAAGLLMSQMSKGPAALLQLNKADTGTFVVSLCGVMASLAYPFIEAAYGDEGISVVAISDLGNAIAIFAVAYYLSFRYTTNGNFNARQILRKVAAFYPLHAFLIAIAFNLGQVKLAGLAGGLIETLAALNSPLMLLSLGIYLDLDISLHESKILFTHIVYKYGIGLLISLFCIFCLPFNGTTRAVLFLLPLMPTSLSTLLYSVEQNLNPRLAAMLISLTMLVSLVITTVTILGFRNAF